MALFSASHSSVGKSSQKSGGTSGAHGEYVTRKTACSLVLTQNAPRAWPGRVSKFRAWLDEQEARDRKNARVIDKVMLALPRELDADQRAALVRRFAQELTGGKTPWLAAFHDKGKDARNPHCHFVLRDRHVETGKRVVETTERGSTERIRALWERVANEALEAAGEEARIDRRSLKAQRAEKLDAARAALGGWHGWHGGDDARAPLPAPDALGRADALLAEAETFHRKPQGHEGPEMRALVKKGIPSTKIDRIREARRAAPKDDGKSAALDEKATVIAALVREARDAHAAAARAAEEAEAARVAAETARMTREAEEAAAEARRAALEIEAVSAAVREREERKAAQRAAQERVERHEAARARETALLAAKEAQRDAAIALTEAQRDRDGVAGMLDGTRDLATGTPVRRGTLPYRFGRRPSDAEVAQQDYLDHYCDADGHEVMAGPMPNRAEHEERGRDYDAAYAAWKRDEQDRQSRITAAKRRIWDEGLAERRQTLAAAESALADGPETLARRALDAVRAAFDWMRERVQAARGTLGTANPVTTELEGQWLDAVADHARLHDALRVDHDGEAAGLRQATGEVRAETAQLRRQVEDRRQLERTRQANLYRGPSGPGM